MNKPHDEQMVDRVLAKQARASVLKTAFVALSAMNGAIFMFRPTIVSFLMVLLFLGLAYWQARKL